VRYFTATDGHHPSILPMRPVIPTSETFTHDHVYGRLVPSKLVIDCPLLETYKKNYKIFMFYSCFIEYVFVLNKFKYYSHFLLLSTSV